MDKDFDEKLDREQKAGIKQRLERDPPIGTLPDGKINYVNPDDPPFEPKIIPK